MLLSRKASLSNAIAEFQAELNDIDAALAGISGKDTRSSAQQRTQRPKSIQEQILHTLKNHPEGGSSRWFVKSLLDEFNREISPRNMSWNLSRLKSEGRLVLDNGRWKMRPLKNETPSEDKSEGVSEITGEVRASPNESSGRLLDL